MDLIVVYSTVFMDFIDSKGFEYFRIFAILIDFVPKTKGGVSVLQSSNPKSSKSLKFIEIHEIHENQ